MNFQTRYKREKIPSPDVGGGERITESAGYIPFQKRVEQMTIAGRRLMAHRAEQSQYDFAEGVNPDESFSDPTRRQGFDLADATRIANNVEAGIKNRTAEAEKKKAEEAVKASQASPEGS